jgi:hypothetical protein
MARRSGTLGISEVPEDIIADVLGEEKAAEGSVDAANASSGASDGSSASPSVSVDNVTESSESISVVINEEQPQQLPPGSKEVYRIDFMMPSVGMLRIAKVLLPTGEEVWRFSIWDNPITSKQAAKILKDNGLIAAVPHDVLPYLPELLEE